MTNCIFASVLQPEISKKTVKNYPSQKKNFKFAPMPKRFWYSESASLCEQKSPPNPRGYRDKTN